MKTILLILASIQMFSARAEVIPVTLDQAFSSALEKTETVAIGEARIGQVKARKKAALSRFLPTLNFSANYLQQDTKGVGRQSASVLGGRQSFTRLTLAQPLFDGYRDFHTYFMSRADQEVQKHNLTTANYNTFVTVARNFYAVLSGEKEVENIRRTIALANERLSEIDKRTRIGRSRNVEHLAAKAQVSVLEAQQMAAEGELVTAWDQFVLLTGLPRDVKLTEIKDRPGVPQDLSHYLRELNHRPDVAALEAQVESAERGIRVARAGHLPGIGVTGNYYTSREGPQAGNHWDISVGLTFQLFGGGLVSAQVQEASKQHTEARLLLSQMRRQGEIAIRTAYNNLISSLNQLKALESALKSTEENYREQEKNYRFGQANNLDVIQALNTFQDTKRTFDRTRYLALAAWAELRAATAQVEQAEAKNN